MCGIGGNMGGGMGGMMDGGLYPSIHHSLRGYGAAGDQSVHGMPGSGLFGVVGGPFGKALSGIGDRDSNWRDSDDVGARDSPGGRSRSSNGGNDRENTAAPSRDVTQRMLKLPSSTAAALAIFILTIIGR